MCVRATLAAVRREQLGRVRPYRYVAIVPHRYNVQINGKMLRIMWSNGREIISLGSGAVSDCRLMLFSSPFPLEYGTYPVFLLPLFADILQRIRDPSFFKVSTSISFEREAYTTYTLLQDTSVL
jgi:hypothetical protein